MTPSSHNVLSASAQEAAALARSGKVEEAVALAYRCVSNAEVRLPEHGFLASLLVALGRREEAARVVRAAEQLDEGTADASDGLAAVLLALGEHEQAHVHYRDAARLAPGHPQQWYNLACSERSLGRLEEAEAACDRAIEIDPRHYPSYLLRSEMRVQRPEVNHIAQLEDALRHGAGDYRARVFLGYALGKELDDVGRYDDAFGHFDAAARARREQLSYDIAADEAKLGRIAEVYTPALCGDGTGGTGAGGGRFIFIVGLPRSGTTLVERILSGLPGVHSNGETDHFSRALLAEARGAGDVFERAAAAEPGAVAARYARLAGGPREGHFLIEKLPLNYLYLGAIARALPQAKLIVVRRSPVDSCFAMFRTLFGAGYPFSYDLVELGRYFAAYEGLMAHWRRILGDRLHEVVYEDLVREPRRAGAALAGHCGLAWDDGAIEIQNNRAASLTASAAQVRRPIYGSSSGRWRHYQSHLEPLLHTLRERSVPVAN